MDMPPPFGVFGGCCVLQALKDFIADLTEGAKPTERFDDNDYRVAMAALLIHAAAIDGNLSGAERDLLTAFLQRRFALDDAATNALVEQATQAEQEAVDLYGFTRLLNRSLDDEGRSRVVKMMWELALSDGAITEFEDNLIWRAADLLHVSQHERIALRQRVAAERGLSNA
jgi:uncharacterized tellurite resistance protein B-like protein